MTIDRIDVYLNTLLERPEYIRLKLSSFPDDIIPQYNLKDKVDSKGFMCVKVTKGMYGLPHAVIIAQNC